MNPDIYQLLKTVWFLISWLLDPDQLASLVNSVDPDQLASGEAS